MIVVGITDKITFNGTKKYLISCRDGIQEYLGLELGLKPFDKKFRVYRPPEEIQKINDSMVGLPIINNHVEPEGEIKEDIIHGKILTSSIIDKKNDKLMSSVAISNTVDLNDKMLKLVADGKRELSLGYRVELKPSENDDYDFTQHVLDEADAVHHLALVDKGRCGNTCKIKDSKEVIMFIKDGKLDIDFIKSVGQAIKALDSAQTKEVLVALNVVDADEAEKDMAEKKKEIEDMESEKKKTDECMKKKDEELQKTKDELEKEKEKKQENKMSDADMIAALTDSQEFKKMVDSHAQDRVEIIAKAEKFGMTDTKDKCNFQIMKDTVTAVIKDADFGDDEVAGAFKALNGFSMVDSFKGNESTNLIDKMGVE